MTVTQTDRGEGNIVLQLYRPLWTTAPSPDGLVVRGTALKGTGGRPGRGRIGGGDCRQPVLTFWSLAPAAAAANIRCTWKFADIGSPDGEASKGADGRSEVFRGTTRSRLSGPWSILFVTRHAGKVSGQSPLVCSIREHLMRVHPRLVPRASSSKGNRQSVVILPWPPASERREFPTLVAELCAFWGVGQCGWATGLRAKQPVMAERRQSLAYRLRNGCVQRVSVQNWPVRR